MSNSPGPSRAKLIFFLVIGISAASTAAIFIRFGQAEGAPSIVIAAARLSIASLLLAPVALKRYLPNIRELSPRESILALISGVFLALHFATWITSLEYTSVASSVVLVTTTPLWVAVFSPLFLREHTSPLVIVGMAVSLVGGIIIGLSDTSTAGAWSMVFSSSVSMLSKTALFGDLLALAGAWMAAGYIMAGRKLRGRMPLIPYVFIVYGIAAVILVAIMLVMKQDFLGYPPITYLWFGLLAVVPQLLGHTTFNWALKYVPASFVSVILLGEPIGSTVLAYLVFQEQPGAVKLIGGLLILFGIWLAARKS